ncbi:Glycosyl hydrolase family 65, N-terminal domain [Pelagirhabdus alkalitolerans]|uniref:Glycosyl hydrolase family 65, N-terminal domain n=1 Tax=Pelagirhabdus alkalitolerans TaxID=1612202 RepID=A0A1G6MQE9_9BACI|nr:glycoside hydrolase N-terminal domain-containing protein [Pelagirhabdus alkalitolerans]SDC57742.1 Glycosyl hydrolase family 65, N-terminal domain [Pelagirhabdus alkalitolerans]
MNIPKSLYKKGCHSYSYEEIPDYNAKTEWREGMVSGNGENGYVTSGSPYSDTFIFQYMQNLFPSNAPRFIPNELPEQLDEARRNVFNLNDNWKIKYANGEVRKQAYYYSYHPAHQLRIKIRKQSELKDYMRWTNYETAETGVAYEDVDGQWVRKSFTSRVDNVTITKIEQSSSHSKINLVISIDDVLGMSGAHETLNEVKKLQYKKLVDDSAQYIAQVGHYPSYEGSELALGGYAGLTRVYVVNGTKERILLPDTNESINVGNDQNPAIEVKNAEAVYLVTQSNRTHDMGKLNAFKDQLKFSLLDQLLLNTNQVVSRYIDSNGHFDYDEALNVHIQKHAPEFNAAYFQLKSNENNDKDNEAIIERQKQNQNQVDPDFLNKIYLQGRYAMICSSGLSAPRLYGMWTGEWDPGWRSIHTLDANVNLQVAAMNTGGLTYLPLGYIYFFLRQAPDFEYNARMAYHMHDALQVSVNSDGDRAMHIEYDNDYPFQYWNAGASWGLLPIFEYWQCYGNRHIPIHEQMRIHDLQSLLSVRDGGLDDQEFDELLDKGYLDLEKDILLPLLTKQANFWEQICTPEYFTDVNGVPRYQKGKKGLLSGEKYLILPAYSPENHPIGYDSHLTANATMDIAAARDGLFMVIELEKAVKRPGYERAVRKWERLLKKLPEYLYDEDGALREWSMISYKENNNHRHLSHLYPAWPGYETKTDSILSKAAKKALENRNTANTKDATAGHGWMHKALVSARLKDPKGVVDSLLPMMTHQGYYTSLMTDHDTDRSHNSYCTDTLYATVAVIHEVLLYSNKNEIELLPALPLDWSSGMIHGLTARTQVEVQRLSWDLDKKSVNVTICSHSNSDQVIQMKLGFSWKMAEVDGKISYNEFNENLKVSLKAGVELTINYTLI